MRPGVQDQPGQHSETSSPLKKIHKGIQRGIMNTGESEKWKEGGRGMKNEKFMTRDLKRRLKKDVMCL